MSMKNYAKEWIFTGGTYGMHSVRSDWLFANFLDVNLSQKWNDLNLTFHFQDSGFEEI